MKHAIGETSFTACLAGRGSLRITAKPGAYLVLNALEERV